MGSWGLAGGYEAVSSAEKRAGLHDDRADFGSGTVGSSGARVVVVGKAPSRGPKAPIFDDFGPEIGLREHRPQTEGVGSGSGSGGRVIMVRRSGGSRE